MASTPPNEEDHPRSDPDNDEEQPTQQDPVNVVLLPPIDRIMIYRQRAQEAQSAEPDSNNNQDVQTGDPPSQASPVAAGPSERPELPDLTFFDDDELYRVFTTTIEGGSLGENTLSPSVFGTSDIAVSYGNVDEHSVAYQVQLTMILAAVMCMSGQMREVGEAWTSFVFSHPLGSAFARWSGGNGLETLSHLSDLRRLQFESLRTGQSAFDPSLSFSVFSEIDPQVFLIARIQELYPDRLRGAIFEWVWLVITRFPVAIICRYLAEGHFIYTTWVGLGLILRGEAMFLAVSMQRGGMFQQMRSLVRSATAAGISSVFPLLHLVSDLLTQLLTMVTTDTKAQSQIADGYITAFGYAIQDRIRAYVSREAVRWAMREARSLRVRTNPGLANFFGYLLAICHPLISNLRAIISSNGSNQGDETISLEDYCFLFGQDDLSHVAEAPSTSLPPPSHTAPQSPSQSPCEKQTVQQASISAPSNPSAPSASAGPSTVLPPQACLQLYLDDSMDVEPLYDPAVVSDKEMALARDFEGLAPRELGSAAGVDSGDVLPIGPAAQGLDRREDESMDSSNSSNSDFYQESEESEYRGLISAYAPHARNPESDSNVSNDDEGLIRVSSDFDHEAPHEDVSDDDDDDGDNDDDDDDDDDMYFNQSPHHGATRVDDSDGVGSSPQPFSPESGDHHDDYLDDSLNGLHQIGPREFQSSFDSPSHVETTLPPTPGPNYHRWAPEDDSQSRNQNFGMRASFNVEAQQDSATNPRTLILSIEMDEVRPRGRPPSSIFNPTLDDASEPIDQEEHESPSPPLSLPPAPNANSPPRTRSRTRLVASARARASNQATTGTAMQTDQNGRRSNTTPCSDDDPNGD